MSQTERVWRQGRQGNITKIHICNSRVLSVLLCASEIQTLLKTDVVRLQDFHMTNQRRTVGHYTGCSTDEHRLRGQKCRGCRTAPVEHFAVYVTTDDQLRTVQATSESESTLFRAQESRTAHRDVRYFCAKYSYLLTHSLIDYVLYCTNSRRQTLRVAVHQRLNKPAKVTSTA